jgi:MATE family multidrug resistance protein
MLMSAAMMLLIPETLVGAFLGAEGDRSDAVLALAVSYLAFAALFQVFDGGQVVGAGVLRGLHDTRVPMIYAAIGYWGVGLPVGVLLAFWAGLRGEGLWVGLAAGLAIVAGLMTFRWINRERLGLTRDRPGLSESGL